MAQARRWMGARGRMDPSPDLLPNSIQNRHADATPQVSETL